MSSGAFRPSMRGRLAAAVSVAAASAVLSGCELEEITLVEAEDVVVAEVYVQVSATPSGENRVTAWLHRTLDADPQSARAVSGAQVLVTDARGFSLELAEVPERQCVWVTPADGTGTCYSTTTAFAGWIQPGDALEVEIALPGGGLLRGSSTVPGDFDLITPAGGSAYEMEPLSPLEVRWTGSAGARAYVSETLVSGLREALAPRGIAVEDDPLYLLGLSVSSSDTTIVFPGEFGVFERFSLDQALALALQEGLPEKTEARVTITAADRNYVNWLRGGNFNPSGPVKIPSLRGDGTGVFGTSVSRSFTVSVRPAGSPAASSSSSGG